MQKKKKKIYPNTVFVITLCTEYLPQGFCSRKLNYTIGPADSQIHGRKHFYNDKYPSGIFKYVVGVINGSLSHLKVNLQLSPQWV